MKQRKPRVIYWQNIPSPYFVGRFNALEARGNLDFEAWFNEEREPDRSWDVDTSDWSFRARYIPARPIGGYALHLPLAELRHTHPDLLICLYDRLSFAVGSLAARAAAARLAFRVLPNYDSWSDRSWWKELGKHFLFRAIDGAIVPGPDGSRLADRYGLPAARTYAVTQSVDVAHYCRARHLEPRVRRERRAELGLHGCVFVYVGRLWAGKGLDHLVTAYRLARARHPDMSLLLLGDGVHEAKYRAMTSDLDGVVFAGFVQPREIPDYYALADVMTFPTLGDPHGLVVDEAMAAGLPVISSDAAGDIRRRLPDGEAGYVVPSADASALADRMVRLAADPGLRRQFAEAGTRLVASHDHRRWVSDFEAAVERLLERSPRRTAEAHLAHALGQGIHWSRPGGTRPLAPLVQGCCPARSGRCERPR
jgi:glycosyltransferase involved in cell wall biosynthesis